ncbi:hypothetical protein DFA_07837 [Cavenderia fasciculata]|uniref:F-box domain-containing protein n=1 Tax=Cavenderia fasciculata TaxID=261658 RepID=F4Q3P2_CACFS|nr:uncharacterized protein DFA_07837 [Cavenderia fasciculata]EGG16858.1 hypothetical protein DFA_07837 [Cavenderia fasciculata]|eukprot:XP_004355332.1 hypothetical protein DFA_07837 [Cavenderia fasciculata]
MNQQQLLPIPISLKILDYLIRCIAERIGIDENCDNLSQQTREYRLASNAWLGLVLVCRDWLEFVQRHDRISFRKMAWTDVVDVVWHVKQNRLQADYAEMQAKFLLSRRHLVYVNPFDCIRKIVITMPHSQVFLSTRANEPQLVEQYSIIKNIKSFFPKLQSFTVQYFMNVSQYETTDPNDYKDREVLVKSATRDPSLLDDYNQFLYQQLQLFIDSLPSSDGSIDVHLQLYGNTSLNVLSYIDQTKITRLTINCTLIGKDLDLVGLLANVPKTALQSIRVQDNLHTNVIHSMQPTMISFAPKVGTDYLVAALSHPSLAHITALSLRSVVPWDTVGTIFIQLSNIQHLEMSLSFLNESDHTLLYARQFGELDNLNEVVGNAFKPIQFNTTLSDLKISIYPVSQSRDEKHQSNLYDNTPNVRLAMRSIYSNISKNKSIKRLLFSGMIIDSEKDGIISILDNSQRLESLSIANIQSSPELVLLSSLIVERRSNLLLRHLCINCTFQTDVVQPIQDIIRYAPRLLQTLVIVTKDYFTSYEEYQAQQAQLSMLAIQNNIQLKCVAKHKTHKVFTPLPATWEIASTKLIKNNINKFW